MRNSSLSTLKSYLLAFSLRCYYRHGMVAEASNEARFVHSRASQARTAARRLARQVNTYEARAVAERQGLLLNAIEELTVEHGREVDDHCVGCGQPYPCITIRRCASVWSNDRNFDERMWTNNHRP